jgi:hypothetical protein
MVSRLLKKRIKALGSYWEDYRVVTNEPRHLIRSVRPSVAEVIFGEIAAVGQLRS